MIPQLPFDQADFATLVQGPQYIYVDKTRILADLFRPLATLSHLFLARPRRFGKTLLLSTVEALFQGRQNLFRDTWIGQTGHWDWEGHTHPVLRLNLGLRGRHAAARLESKLGDLVYHQARRHRIPLPPEASPARGLRLLLTYMAEAAGSRVVVLVDEYDTAITENLDRPAVLEDVMDVMRAFYGALKDSSDAGLVECTLVTGITRLARAGLFSGANHLADLSHEPKAHNLLGFTHAELRAPRVAALVAQGARHLGCTAEELYTALERQYNGYRFAAGQEAVYNPFTLAGGLRALVQPDADALWNLDRLPRSWIHTGTPKVLLRGLAAHRPGVQVNGQPPTAADLEKTHFDVARPDVTALMYQAGYLTRGGPELNAPLVFPNREVQASFTESLQEWWEEHTADWLVSPTVQAAADRRHALTDALWQGDAETVRRVLHGIFTALGPSLRGLPDAVRTVANYEVHYQDMLAMLFNAMGLPAVAEVPAGVGRADLTLEWEGPGLFLVELKTEGRPDAGLRQVFERNYPALFQGRGRPVTVVGLRFNPDTRTLDVCRLHRLGRFDPRTERWDHEPYPLSLAELGQRSEAERQRYMCAEGTRKASCSGNAFSVSCRK